MYFKHISSLNDEIEHQIFEIKIFYKIKKAFTKMKHTLCVYEENFIGVLDDLFQEFENNKAFNISFDD